MFTYGEASTPDGDPLQIAHFDAPRQFQQDVFAIVAAQDVRLPVQSKSSSENLDKSSDESGESPVILVCLNRVKLSQ